MLLAHVLVLTLASLVGAIPQRYARGSQSQVPLSTLGPVIDLGYTAVIGNDSYPGVNFYGAIPYIQAPLGDLRWRAPVQLDETVQYGSNKPMLDARSFGPLCIQQPAVVGVGDEDCVTLNVWTPSGANTTSKLPVVIYIHGGGNYYNSAQGFPMADWVNITGGQLVAVNIQYRLGLLGYLASAKVMADGVVNAGLLDQRAAFEWVQRHISKFGGDPSHVTISGQSSGAGSVLNHLVWQGGVSEPPFSAAILQSIGNDPFGTSEVYEQCFGNVTEFVGCSDAADVMTCLRQTPVRVLTNAVNHRPQPLCKYLPIVDGKTILDYPSVSITKGDFSKVPVIAGHTTNDGTTFVGSPTSVTNVTQLYTALTSSRYKWLTYATFERALTYYNQSDFSSFYDMAQTLMGDTQFTCWDWYLTNQSAKFGMPAYNYRWNTPDPVQLAAAPYKGVMHTSELYYLFDGTNSGVSSVNAQNSFVPFNATEVPLAHEAVSYWTSFSRVYNPSTYKYSPATLDWPGLDAANGSAPNSSVSSMQRIVPWEGNSTTETATYTEFISQVQIERCLFWVSVANETRV